jgi:lipopolysaccharide biosynthesis regulator YciM
LVALLTVFGVVSVGIWTATLNTELVTLRVPGFPPREFQTSLWVVSLLAILVGVLGTLLYTVVLSSKAAFVRWRRMRSDLKLAEDTELIQSGLAAAVRGEHATALQRFERVLQHDPERLDAWVQGGNIARAAGDLDRAVEMHTRARGLSPDDPGVHDALARDFEALGEYARAVGHMEQRLASEPKGDAELFARLRDLFARQGRWDEALEAQEKHVKALRDPKLRADAGAVERGLKLEKARSLLEQGTEQGRQKARQILGALRKDAPQFVPAYLVQGRARKADGDPEGAVEAWTEGVQKTHDLELLNELVTHYFDAGDPELAIRAFRKAADTIGGDDGRAARLGLALLYSRLEMIEEARQELEQLEDEVEFSPTVTYHLAKLSARQGDAKAAAERFRQVIQASNILEPGYVCRNCGVAHEGYVMRCPACGMWGTVALDTSDELRPVERAVSAPRV